MADNPSEEAEAATSSKLQAMGYSKEYARRAMAVHRRSKRGRQYDLSVLVEIATRLKAKDAAASQPSPYRPPFSSSVQALRVSLGDIIDYRFENGRFILCRVIKMDKTLLLLHPVGEPVSTTKHDRECDVKVDFERLAVPKSQSLRKLKSSTHPMSGISVDDYCDVYADGQWVVGRVIKGDAKSAQRKVLFVDPQSGQHKMRWFHLENESEVAPFHTMTAKINDEEKSKEIKLSIDMDSHASSVRSMSPMPRYSFHSHHSHDASHHSHDTHDTPVSLDLSHHSFDAKSDKDEMFDQLSAFGYEADDIAAAMNSAKGSLDINQLVEYITEREKRVLIKPELSPVPPLCMSPSMSANLAWAPIAFAMPAYPSYADVEQFPALPPSPKFANLSK